MSYIEQAQKSIQSFIESNPNGVVILRWATATGKTGLSLQIAQGVPSPNFEIISADSRQIYKYMDIGTDKVSKKIRGQIPHHQLNLVEPDKTYTAGQWKKDVYKLIPEIQARGNIPLIVGGTGLYINMLYKNYQMPEVAPDEEWREKMMKLEEQTPGVLFSQLEKIDPLEAQKHHPNSLRYVLRALEIYEKIGKTKTALAKENPVDWPLLMMGLRREKEETNRLINARIKKMLTWWLIDEVQWLLDKWYDMTHVAMNGIWYKEIIWYLQGDYDLERAEELLKRNTHHLAKKQRTWFRKYIAEEKQNPKEKVKYKVFYW